MTLDLLHAAKLAQMAERTHVNKGTLARFLLTQAIDEADPDVRQVVALLDGLPEAFEQARKGLDDARTGRTVRLDEL